MVEQIIYPAAHQYTSDLTSRIVAQTGIPSDRHHLGKIILQSFKDALDHIHQIDGATGESQTFKTALQKTVQCAKAFRSLGLRVGDIVSILAPNHLDISIPLYAGLCVGVAISPDDRTYGARDLRDSFRLRKPKVVFCESEKVADVEEALKQLQTEAIIITFDDSERSFKKFIEDHANDTNVDDFIPTDFNSAETIAVLLPTSGTTGLPKCAALSHANLMINLPFWLAIFKEFPTPTRMMLLLSPLQWLTAVNYILMTPIYRMVGLQSSSACTPEHIHYLVNTYRPTFAICSPMLMSSVIMHPGMARCDLSSFDTIVIGGSAVTAELFHTVKKLTPKTKIRSGFGMTETGIVLWNSITNFDTKHYTVPLRNIEFYKIRLVDVDSGKDIQEPNVSGELWVKDGSIFLGYYNDPESTQKIYSEDGWLKTGDLFYRDENFNYFFVERLKLLMKYRSHHVAPVELETVIKQHPGVLEAAVTSVPDPECGDLPVACVMRKDGHTVTAQEIKDLVKESLMHAKQLHGGVIFMDSLPLTPSVKIDRKKTQTNGP